MEEKPTFCAQYHREQEDSIVEDVRQKFLTRSQLGIQKYQTTLDRKDLSVTDWIEHAIQESMDLTLYLTKLKKELNESK